MSLRLMAIANNKRRTKRIGRIITNYRKREGSTAPEALTDILTDLRHYCDSKGLDFGALDQKAHEHYSGELHDAKFRTAADQC